MVIYGAQPTEIYSTKFKGCDKDQVDSALRIAFFSAENWMQEYKKERLYGTIAIKLESGTFNFLITLSYTPDREIIYKVNTIAPSITQLVAEQLN